MFKTIVATALIVSATAANASASSDGAWKALFAKVNGTCIGQSGMASPEASAPVVFDDAAGKIALMLRGSMGKGKPSVNLICLYDKKTGKASIAEYRWLGR
ncbi:hypothetical protein ASE04_04830 [Rhizobium sp. Root708]|uniref:hypothetical protein n=1 Tax=Rhizobium sp. Root708 TaxID=1736592 RepID=UPI0006F85093|nr:hypothetical protein [Rhizobium sp. Root708]KRB55362.1 hypothetical protein ASE04_04830 [Rhizobium sp. Root708]